MESEVNPSLISDALDPAGTPAASAGGPRSAIWQTARGPLALDRPRIMGVLNVTPDSFWDGGRYPTPADALGRAESLLTEGADLIDVGGESTRPGADAVPPGEEIRRTAPVIDAIVREWPDALVSIDTVKAEVAAAALDAGAAVVNDVSALRLDPAMARTCAQARAGLVLMHSRGGVERMASYDLAVYGEDVVAEVAAELEEAVERALGAGVAADAVVLDPGLGFSKRTHDSVAVLRGLGRLAATGYAVLIGPSRKRFLGEVAGGLAVEDRLPGTIAACVAGWLAGARVFRVHDVGPVREALAVAAAVGGEGRS